MLTLKRASKSRPSGQWSDDDYGVFDGERHVGPHHVDARGAGRSPLVLDDHGACAAEHA
jgi:hypothetical protein